MKKATDIKHLLGKVFFFIFKGHVFCDLSDFNFTMDRFIRLSADNDYKAIKKRNLPIPLFVLKHFYNDILKQYALLSKNDEYIKADKKRSVIESLYFRHELFRLSLIALSNSFIKEKDEKKVLAILDDNGIRGENIKSVLTSEIKMIKLKLKNLEAQEPKKEEEKQKKVTRADYFKVFARLSEAGYNASKDMCVLDYVETLNVHRDNVKRQEAELEKIKSKR
jgi:hypothetical protein